MPRAKKQQRTFSDDFKGFVTINLTVEDEKIIDALEVDNGRTFDELATLIDQGFKVSFKADLDQGSVCCTLMDNRKDSPTRGFALSGWGSEALDAANAVLYKHIHQCSGVWPTEFAGRAVTKYR